LKSAGPWGILPVAMAIKTKSDAIWVDGKLVPFEDAKVHVLTHTLHYGVAVFEGIRAYRTADGRSNVFRLKEHVRRLFDSAHIYMMEIPFTPEQLEQACLDTLKANKLAEGYIRPLAFYGAGSLGLRRGIRAKVSSFNRMHVNVNMVRAKCSGQYVNSFLANREASLGGFDEAILLDTEGYPSEGSGENLFIVKDGVLQTPPLSSAVLNGITRDSVLRIARDLSIPVREEKFTRDTMYLADELFMTGTAAEVTPVREVDHRKIGKGEAGPITKKLQEAYFAAVKGSDPRYKEWLTPYGV